MLLFLLIASVSFVPTEGIFASSPGKSSSSSPMEDMLDVMQEMMVGGGQFNRRFIKKVRTCMTTIDPELPYVHEKIWQGIIDYWDTRGSPTDRYGHESSKFSECNVTQSSYKNMIIYEPCNYASNAAYYHLTMELCYRRVFGRKFHMPPQYVTALGKMFAALAPVSSFLHATNTKLGYQQDVGVIKVIGYLIYQGIMEALPYRSPILNDLSLVPRALTSVQIVDAVQTMHKTEPVSKWYNTFAALDIPDYIITNAASCYTMVHLNFDDHIAKLLHPIIVSAFRIPEEQQRFFTEDFLPELKRATSHLNRKRNFQNNFLGNSMGTLAKVIHAYVWHEFRLFNSSVILKPTTNFIGRALLPKLNTKFNGATNYKFYQHDFQKGVNVYPGEERCNKQLAHPKWHVQSAIMLVDFYHLADEMNRLLKPTRNILG